MTVVLDTSSLPPDRRAVAVAEVIRFSSSVPTQTLYNCPDDEVAARFEYFTFGGTHLLKSQNASLGLVTTPALLKGAGADLLTVTLKPAGTAAITQGPSRRLRGPDLFMTELWRPFEFLDDGGENAAFYMSLDQLGLPRDYVARAGEAVHTSPMAAQLRRHLEILFRDADAISQSPAASMIGQATTDLVRAALVSAVDEEPFRRDDWEQNLTTVVKSYVAQHLADPNLGAERIARAMFISVRQLYKLWETEPQPLGQWILERRLDAARHELASPRGLNQTVAAIARRWGFADSTHFSRRFRQAYGMSPREWRHACRTAPTRRGLCGDGARPCTRSRSPSTVSNSWPDFSCHPGRSSRLTGGALALRQVGSTQGRTRVETRDGRGDMLLIHDLWFRPTVWTPWLRELDEAGYDAAVLHWSGEHQPSGIRRSAVGTDFNALLNAARKHIEALESRPIVIGHGVGGVVAERLLLDGDAAAAISLAPVPEGYSAIPAAARLLRRSTRLALLSMQSGAVVPTFPQFRRAIANVGSNTDARHFYETHVTAATPRNVLLGALRGRVPAESSQPRRGPLLLAVGGQDQLVQEFSIALLHRNYRRGQPIAITDYKVFPDLDHTFGLGTQSKAVLFYCLDWLTAQNM